MTVRIVKTEKFIPKVGNPVFQVIEELETNGQILLLDPRNPNAEELEDSDDAFAAAQQARISELEAEKAALEARIAELIEQLPFNPRIIDASAFVARIAQDELLRLFASTDPVIQQIVQSLIAWKTNDWPIIFESSEMQQMIGYLVQSEFLTADQAAELTRDATREEAYQAD